jgi:endonuclease/exonuclease/phosphatase family metal-dependent hydrolase
VVTLRVASYNIHAGSGQDNVFDLDRTAAEISSLHADVVGLQEVDVHWGARSQWRDTLQELGSRLHMRVAFAPIYDLDPPAAGQPRRQYGVALLSRHPVLARENHEITRLSTQSANPVPARAPGLLEAVVQIGGARRHVDAHVYVTHLDYRADPWVRQLQVADTRRILGQDPPGADWLLLGDFNAEPTAPELQPFWQSVSDVWAHAPARSGAGLTYPAAAATRRIDYVTASPDITAVAAAVPADELASNASDHRPVVATVWIPRGSENGR